MNRLHADINLMSACFYLLVICIIGQCVGGDPIFFDFDEDDELVSGRAVRATNMSDAKSIARKLLNNNSVALKHLALHKLANASTSALSPLEKPLDENDDTPAPMIATATTTAKPRPLLDLVQKTMHVLGRERYRTIVVSVGLARSLTQLTPSSQHLFKTSCLVKQVCTEEFVSGKTLTWITPGVSARARTRLWHQLLCSIRPDVACPVDGGWGGWTDWTDCSATCGSVGQRVRRRLCERPPPSGGGLPCHGRKAQIQYCVSRGCGLDRLAGFMTERNPSQQLSLQIVQHSVHAHPELEQRCVREHCSYEYARDLVGNASINAVWASLHCLKQAVACPLVGGWTEWTAFSECSAAPCGDGQKLRFRACSDPPPSIPEARCRGKPFGARDCSVPCAATADGARWAPFGRWSGCSAQCGVGTQQRHRTCLRLAPARRRDVPPLAGPDRAADAVFRRRRGGLAAHRALRRPGRRRRRAGPNTGRQTSRLGRGSSYTGPRRIDLRLGVKHTDKHTTKHTTEAAESGPLALASEWRPADSKAAACGGSSREVRVCRPDCPRDGGWAEWSDWSRCSAACGPGVSTRDRLCAEPAPGGGGRTCDGTGSEVHYCFQRPCTVETRLLASFNGSGYLIYRPLYMPSALLLVYVRFRPEVPDAVLLHRFQNKCPEAHNCDWTKLSLVSGFLVLESYQRHCKVKLQGKPALEMCCWHEVAVAIMGDRAFMRLDNAEEHKKAYLDCTPEGPNYDMDMYVGSDRNRRAAFRGTVSALAVNFMEYSLQMEADWTAGGVPAISEGVSTAVATADDVYVRLDADDFFTAQCPGNDAADRGARLDFVATFMIKQHGVLMFTRGLVEASFIFVKTGRVFQLCMQLAAARECLASSQNAELGRWYRLRVLVEPKVMTMVVNFVYRTRLMRGLLFPVCRKIVYVGGGPPDTLKKIDEPNGFQGLVESFLVNGRRDSSREMSVKEWGGMVSSAVASLADHYTEAVYQQGHSPTLSCDYSDVVAAARATGNASFRARTRWLRLDELIDSDSGRIENAPPYSVLRLDPRSKDVEGLYACLVSTPSRSWLLHAFGVSFVRTAVVVAESLAEEWVAGMSVLVGVLLLLMAAGLLYVSKSRRFGLFPGLMRMVYGERLSNADQLDYLQLQTGELVLLTPSRRRLVRASKRALIVSHSERALATPSRTVTISPSRELEYFLEPSKQVRFARDQDTERTPSAGAFSRSSSSAAASATSSAGGSARSPSGRVAVAAAAEPAESDDCSPDDSSDDSSAPLLSADTPPAALSGAGSARRLSSVGSASGSGSARRFSSAGSASGSGSGRRLSDGGSWRPSSQLTSDSASEGYPPMPGTAEQLSDDSEPFTP